MTFIVDGTNGLTFPNSTTQASAGSVLQVVQASYSTGSSTTSTSYVTTNLSASITPKFSTSKILIIVNGTTYTSAAGVYGYYAIFRGTVAGTNLCFNVLGVTSSDVESTSAMTYLDSPSTTSATTYTVGMRATTGTVYWSASSALSTITLMEIAA